jgi:hypothetical protein
LSPARLLAACLLAGGALAACEPSEATSTEPGDAGIHTEAGEGGLTKRSGPKKDPGGNCVTCHLEEYEHVRHPPHVDVKPTTCAVCHTQDGWRPEVLHHDFWPLTGAHQGRPDTQCAWCHGGKPWRFKGTPKACVGCHQEDFDEAKFPEHSTFGTKCADCHSTDAWKPAKHPPKEPAPVPVPATSGSAKVTTSPKGTATPRSPTPTHPTATAVPTPAPTPVPIPKPTAVPTTRPPDVVTRPSKRR